MKCFRFLSISLLVVLFLTSCATFEIGIENPPQVSQAATKVIEGSKPTQQTLAQSPTLVIPVENTLTATAAPSATSTPVALTPTKAVTIQLVVMTTDNTIEVVNPIIPLGAYGNPAFTALLNRGMTVNGTAIVLDPANNVFNSVDANGTRSLDFIKDPTYGLALWHGESNAKPRLAWGTRLFDFDPADLRPSTLQTSLLDGSQLETLLTQDLTSNPRVQYTALGWSADGQQLYFSQEPVGLGGIYNYDGAWSLYQINITSKAVTELITSNYPSALSGCLDAFFADFSLVAEHCVPNVITIRDLSSGSTSTIQPPTGITGYTVMGSTSFSPDGTRLAFALAKRDPTAEQGWVAVSDGISGSSKLVLTGEPGFFYTVIGWLNDQTLLVQSRDVACATGCSNQIWAVGIDGSKPVKVADGTFLTLLETP